MLCDQICGCAVTSPLGTVTIGGSGTPLDPWTLETVNGPDIATIQTDIANLQASVLALPGTYVNAAGDTMAGPLIVSFAGGGQMLALKSAAANYAYLAWWQNEVRMGWNGAQVTTGHIWLSADLNDLILSSTLGDVAFRSAGTERMRLLGSGGQLLVGKSTSGLATVGLEHFTTGAIFMTRDITAACESLNKVSGGAVSGTTYAEYRLSGTVIGSITRNAATSAVLYNTSSDENLKTVIGELDPELAEYVLALVTPMMYSWNEDPDHTPNVGYIAQRVAAAWPQSVELGLVTPGVGDVSDRTFDEDGNETTPEGAWRPWMMSPGVIVPLLHASLVRTTTKLSYLRAEFDEYKAQTEERLAALEQRS